MKKHARIFLSTPSYPKNFQEFRMKLAATLEAYGYEPILVEKQASQGDYFSEKISSLLKTSDFIIVDMTKENSFVTFEMGFASALSIPTIVIVNKKKMPDRIPSFFLEKYPILTYEANDLRTLVERIRTIIEASSKKGERK